MSSEQQANQIFILSGQSNMSGRGGIITQQNHHTHKKHKHWDGIIPQQCSSHPTILRLNAHLQWEVSREPTHIDIDSKKVCGVGPGMAFANAVRERVCGGTIGLVPCAVGGTAISEWTRGGVLYESMIKRAKAAVGCEGEGVIKALLWYQGESDVIHECDAEKYGERMESLVCHVREDLGLPYLPFIQVALASGDGKYFEKVRETQLGMKMPNLVCVDAKGLKLNADNLHLSTEAQVKLGGMLAEAYLCNFHEASSVIELPLEQEPYSDSKGKLKTHPTMLYHVSTTVLPLVLFVLMAYFIVYYPPPF